MGRYTRNKIISKLNSNGVRGTRYYRGVKYPSIPLSPNDIYVYAQEGDRFDQIANQYYNDSSLWWVISIANPTLPQDSYYLPLGVQIRIPSNVASIQSSYNILNNL